ncbi:MAG: hypothetical protein JKX74_03500 [Flavobacteriales bacterium]|nr:hypothetical protein [Flavobacteriales bacterium]
MPGYRLRTLVLAFGFFLLTIHIAPGQVAGGKYDNLFKPYEKGWYEDCLYKAEAMTQKDKYKKDPEPYLYMAMCFYELVRIPELAEFYRSALRYSFKQAAKVRKLDKDGSVYQANTDFYQKLTLWGLEQADVDIDDERYRRAATKYGYILKLDPENRNIRYTKGVHDILARNVSNGLVNMKSALQDIESGYSSDSLTEPAAINAVILFSNQLVQESLVDTLNTEQLIDSARTSLSTGTIMFPNSSRLRDELEKLGHPVPRSEQ